MEQKRFSDILDFAYHSRPKDSHKGDFGRLLLIGGSSLYPNALLLSGEGANAAGPGYLSFYAKEEVRIITKQRAPLTAIYVDSINQETIRPYNVILFGNGLLENEENKALLSFLLKEIDEKQILVIDATGIRMAKSLLKGHRCKIVLTPHSGEASYLLGSETIQKDVSQYLPLAEGFSKENDAYLLLKSHQSILVSPNGEHHRSDSPITPSLAKAGSGDVLAGFLSGLLTYLPSFGYSIEETILFGDQLFHLCFAKGEKKESQALLSGSDFPRLLKEFLLNPNGF